ncbi:hypothetical protein J6590_033476 [Homalodisca vitripennis]|nr:hypothetical protein J6590_033476 [Homalodisca vitripennis]
MGCDCFGLLPPFSRVQDTELWSILASHQIRVTNGTSARGKNKSRTKLQLVRQCCNGETRSIVDTETSPIVLVKKVKRREEGDKREVRMLYRAVSQAETGRAVHVHMTLVYLGEMNI